MSADEVGANRTPCARCDALARMRSGIMRGMTGDEAARHLEGLLAGLEEVASGSVRRKGTVLATQISRCADLVDAGVEVVHLEDDPDEQTVQRARAAARELADLCDKLPRTREETVPSPSLGQLRALAVDLRLTAMS